VGFVFTMDIAFALNRSLKQEWEIKILSVRIDAFLRQNGKKGKSTISHYKEISVYIAQLPGFMPWIALKFLTIGASVRPIPFIRYEKGSLFSIGCCQPILKIIIGIGWLKAADTNKCPADRYPRHYWYRMS
jgi:hypothetical protein